MWWRACSTASGGESKDFVPPGAPPSRRVPAGTRGGDGRIRLRVDSCGSDYAETTVQVGGELSDGRVAVPKDELDPGFDRKREHDTEDQWDTRDE